MPASAAFPFESRYIELSPWGPLVSYGLPRLRLHYVEIGRGRPILFLHGNPTSCYLWRGILPAAAQHGRAIAIDLLGHGLSDKPDVAYTFEEHAAVLRAAVETLGLSDVVLVLHDWGGPLGVHYALAAPANVRGVAAMETFLWPLRWEDFPPPFRLAFRAFRTQALGYLLLQVMNLFVERVLPAAVATSGAVSREALARYRSFYPTIASRKAVRCWPAMLPFDERDSTYGVVTEMERRLPSISFPLLWLRATPGAITTPARLRWLESNVPGVRIRDVGRGGHFIQEEVPGAIAHELGAWLGGLA